MNRTKGQQEQECLDKVKDCFWKPCYPRGNAEMLFLGDALLYGFRENAGQEPELEDELFDIRPVAELIVSARNTDFENAETGKNETKFPDFTCANGLIEHFQISGTKETRKGSQIARDRAKCEKNIDAAIKSGKRYVSESFSVRQSYDAFAASFKSNWDNHMSKLRNYRGNKDSVCFMIESDGFGLRMRLKPNRDYPLGIKTGGIVEHYTSCRDECFAFPLLGRCKELLEFIHRYKDEVQYVIFVSPGVVEIIKTDMARYIASILGDYEFRSACAYCAIYTIT